MITNRYSRYLDERTSSRYHERLAQEREQISPLAKAGYVAGLGLIVGAAAVGTPGGRRMLSRIARHLNPMQEATDIEHLIMRRHAELAEMNRYFVGRARMKAAIEYFGGNAGVRDAIVALGERGNAYNLFHGDTKRLMSAILSVGGRDIKMSPTELEARLKEAINLSLAQRKALGQQIRAARNIYDQTLINKYSDKNVLMKHVTAGDIVRPDSDFQFTPLNMYVNGRMAIQKGTYQEHALRGLVNRKDLSFKDLVVSRGLYRGEDGEFINFRSLFSAFDKAIDISADFHFPFVNIGPYDLLRLGKYKEKASMPFMHIFHKGEPQFIFDVLKGKKSQEYIGNLDLWRLQEDMIYIGGDLYSLATGQLKARNLGLMPSQWGEAPRIFSRVAGLVGDPEEYAKRMAEKKNAWRKILDWLDIGYQEQHSVFDKFTNIFRKYKNKDWEGNLISNIVTMEGRQLTEYANRLKKFIQFETKALPDEVFRRNFGESIKSIYPDIEFELDTEEGILKAFEILATDKKSRLSLHGKEAFLRQWRAYTNNPYEFLASSRTITNKVPSVSMTGEFLSSHESVSKYDDIKKLIQQELIEQVRQVDQHNTQRILKDMMLSGDINTKGIALEASLGHMSVDDIQQQLRDESGILRLAATDFIESRAPWYSYGPMPLTAEKILGQQTKYLMVREPYKFPDYKEWLAALNGSEIEKANAQENIINYFSQFFAGRGNIERFTRTSMLTYHLPFGRIQDALSHLGIGLGPEHTGSGMQIFANLIMRRYLPAILLMGYAGYVSWEIGNLTGKRADEILSDTKQNIRELWAKLRDVTGITSIAKRAARLMPGSEMIMEMPGLHYLDPAKSYEEVKEEADTDRPIRKGRWWSLGNTPFIGGKVMYYLPSEQRMVHADYKFTDSLYGSREEYYQNAWFPTPRYPFAPIRHFIADPYHWERKHYYDRPYPITGPISEISDIPIAGPVLASTVGRIFKPPVRMHQGTAAASSQEQIAQINRSELEQAEAKEYAYITPSGGIQIVSDLGPGTGTADSIDVGGGIGFKIFDTGRGSRGAGRRAVASLNRGEHLSARDKSAILGTNILVPARSYDQVAVDPTGAVTTSSIPYVTAKTYYGLTEMAGIYGWMAQSVTGQPIDSMKIIQDSSKMTSYTRAFWDLNLGGMGGETSEIGRRFVPRERRFQEELDINPIPNRMPSWMPGDNYFINFRRGDPYVKVERGEARLPGEGYEAIWGYHPEEMVLRASQVGKRPDEIMDYLLHIKKGPLPSSVVDAMEEGTEIHREYQRFWKKAGILISAEELVYDEESKTTGHYDALLRTTEGPMVVDVKTVSQKRWEEMLKKGAFEEHIDQVTMYLHALGLKKGGIHYVNRDDMSQTKLIEFEFDKRRYKRIVEKLEQIRGAIRQMIDEGKISRFELYSPLHRFKILADVAPYSEEYKYYSKYVTQQYESLTGSTGPDRIEKEQARELISRTKKQVAQMKKQHRFFPYRFKHTEIVKQRVHVTEILGNDMFLTKEYPTTPISLAGINISDSYKADKAREFISRFIYPGATITIGIDADTKERILDNSMRTMGAVAYAHGMNINLKMMKMGLAKEKEKDWTPAGVHARFSELEIGLGSLWESFAHMDTPFHTKFLHVASPLEEYKRREIFGKSFQQWSFRDQVIPTIQGIMAKDVVGASISGGILGALIYGKTFQKRMAGAKWGAVIFGGLSAIRGLSEYDTGEKWLPQRRIIEREINEYFDILTYVKYRGLYEYAARRAKEQGFDVDELYNKLEQKREATKRQREAIESEKYKIKLKELPRKREAIEKFYRDVEKKRRDRDREIKRIKAAKWAKVEHIKQHWKEIRKDAPEWQQDIIDKTRERQIQRTKEFYERKEAEKRAFYRGELKFGRYYKPDPRLRKLNEQLEAIAEDKELVELPYWAKIAVQYRQRYESTLYGADSEGGVRQILGAMVPKEREYFIEFLKAKPEERKEILELVPRNMRRFLQAAYGMKPDERPSLKEYFKTHYLPHPGWEGWSENKDLQDIKIKVIKNEGLDLSEFGFWKNDEVRTEENNAPVIDINRANTNPLTLQSALAAALKGVGLSDVDIKIDEVANPGIQMDVYIDKDRRGELIEYINNNMDTLL